MTDNKQIYYNLIIDQYTSFILDSKNENTEFHKRKLLHSFNVLNCGEAIFGKLTSDETGALLLHDIGYFCISTRDDYVFHPQTGFDFLVEKGIKNKKILFAVKYHECDESFNDIQYCQLDGFFDILSKTIDADIVANLLESISYITLNKTTPLVNQKLMDCLINEKLGHLEMVNNPYDYFVYMLCGLKLLKFKKSILFLKKQGYANMIVELLKVIETGINTQEAIKFLHEKYNF